MDRQTTSIAYGVFLGLVLFFVVMPLGVALAWLLISLAIRATEPVARLRPAPEHAPRQATAAASEAEEESGAPEEPPEVEPVKTAPPAQPPRETGEQFERRRAKGYQRAAKNDLPPGMAPPVPGPEPPQEDLGRFGAKLIDVTSLDDARRAELEIPSWMKLGALVVEVRPQSVAAKAGVHEGDVITSINRQALGRDSRQPVRDAEMLESIISLLDSPSFHQLHCWRQVAGSGERRLLKLLALF